MDAGSLVALTDHINFLPGTPMMGPNDERFGPRFFSMANAYDADLRKLLHATADDKKITLHDGVYIAYAGPNFETPAEIRAFKTLGAGPQVELRSVGRNRPNLGRREIYLYP